MRKAERVKAEPTYLILMAKKKKEAILLENDEFVGSFLGYLKAVQRKFLPDVVEVKLTRNDSQAELCYREYFTYLPEEIQDFVLPFTVKVTELLLKNSGLQFKITRIEQGVELNVKGAPEVVVAHPLIEILMFGTTNMDNAKQMTNAMLLMLSSISSGKVIRDFNAAVKEEIEQAVGKLRVAMRLAGIRNMEELISMLDEKMFEMMLQQFRQSPSSD